MKSSAGANPNAGFAARCAARCSTKALKGAMPVPAANIMMGVVEDASGRRNVLFVDFRAREREVLGGREAR